MANAWERVMRVGINDLINAAQLETLYGGSILYPYPTVASPLTISSTSALDTNAAGTGARKVLVEGYNALFAPISETVNLVGVASVATVLSYFRVDKITVTDVGSTGLNQGNINATQGGQSVCFVRLQSNRSMMAIFSVPPQKELAITSFFMGSTQTAAQALGIISIRTMTDSAGFPTLLPFRTFQEIGIGSTSIVHKFDNALKIVGPADVKVDCLSQVASVRMNGGFEGSIYSV